MKKNIYIGFDIDETFIHSRDISIDKEPYDDADFNIKDRGDFAFSTFVRPNAALLLNYIRDTYNIFFYTRASQDYALSILKEFDMDNEKLFHSKHIETESVDTLYEGFKRFKVKRLDKIASKMNVNIDDIIFFDDIRNSYEIRPINIVVQVPEYTGSELDNVLGILYSRFKEVENKTTDEIKRNIKSISIEELKNAANPLTKILKKEHMSTSNSIRKNKKEPF